MSDILTNFYKDNAYDINDFRLFLKTNEDVWQELTDYADQETRNKILGCIETYRIFPVNTIPCAPAVYDIGVVMAVPEVATYLGLSHLTVEERVPYWDTYDVCDERKIKALDLAGYYLEFQASTVYPYNGYPPILRFELVAMDLYLNDEKLQFGVDYEIRNNKLYLLSKKACSTSNKYKSFTAYDIAVDYNTVSRYYGDNFKLPKYSDISKDVYNDILQKIVKAALGGPTIRSLREGLSSITDSSDVYDLISAPKEKRELWREWELTPFDFIIEIPALSSTSPTMADIISKYIDVVKPAQSAYIILLKSLFDEIYSRHQKASENGVTIVWDSENKCIDKYFHKSGQSYTNKEEYRLNDNFVTEKVIGYRIKENSSTVITNVKTGEIKKLKY